MFSELLTTLLAPCLLYGFCCGHDTFILSQESVPHVIETDRDTLGSYASTVVIEPGKTSLTLADLQWAWTYYAGGSPTRVKKAPMTDWKRTHTYSRRGTFKTELRLYNNNTGILLAVRSINERIGYLQIQKLGPVFPGLNSTVTFAWTAPTAQNTTEFRIDFGDGQFESINISRYNGTVVSTNHTYSRRTGQSDGTHPVTLQLSNTEFNDFLHFPEYVFVLNDAQTLGNLTLQTASGEPEVCFRTGEIIFFAMVGSENKNLKDYSVYCFLDFGDYTYGRYFPRKGDGLVLHGKSYAPGAYNVTGRYTLNGRLFWSNTLTISVQPSLCSARLAPANVSTGNLTPLLLRVWLPPDVVEVWDVRIRLDWGDGSNNETVNSITLTGGMNNITDMDHCYNNAGQYIVTALFDNDLGQTVYKSQMSVDVTEELFADFVLPSLIVRRQEFAFQIKRTVQTPLNFTVDMGDGKRGSRFSGTLLEPVSEFRYKYKAQGIYNFILTTGNRSLGTTSKLCKNFLSVTAMKDWKVTLKPDSVLVVSETGVELMVHTDSSIPMKITCQTTYGDGEEDIASIQFPLQKHTGLSHVYNKIGKFSIGMRCSNGDHTVLSVTVVSYSQSDYLLTYPEFAAANGTLGQDVGVTVKYRFSLFNLTEPLLHTAYFNPGDGSNIRTFVAQWEFVHVFVERGLYNGSIDLITPKGKFSYPLLTLVGISSLSLDRVDVEPYEKVAFSCSIQHSFGPVKYTLDYGDGGNIDGTVHEATSLSFGHKYTKQGEYTVDFTTVSGTDMIVERVIYHTTVFVDFPVANLIVTVNETVIQQPPGVVFLTIGIDVMGKTIKAMECAIDYGDEYDKKIHYNRLRLKPGVSQMFTYMYTSLGLHNISVNCSNRLGSQVVQVSCTTVHPNFVKEGIFTLEYADPNSPMVVMASNQIEITSRPAVQYHWRNVTFLWAMRELEETRHTFIGNKETQIVQPNKDLLVLKAGTFFPGLYQVTLNISLVTNNKATWLFGRTYILIIGLETVVKFRRGLFTTTGNSTAIIDAKTDTLDPTQAIPNSPGLTFHWACTTFKTTNAVQLQGYLATPLSYNANCSDILDEATVPGIRSLANVSVIQGYAFTVWATYDEKESEKATTYMQFTTDAPEIEISCVVNCGARTAVSSDYKLEVSCVFCSHYEFIKAKVVWELKLHLNVSTTPETFQDVPNFQSFTETLVDNHAALVIKANTLTAGARYRLSARMKIETRDAEGWAFQLIHMNSPPFHGTCYTTPHEGILTSLFQTTCSGWLDDGFEDKYRTDNRPFALTYKHYIKNGEEIIPFFQGGEATSPRSKLPILSDDNSGQYQIITRIYDVQEDYAEVMHTIQITVTSRSLEEAAEQVATDKPTDYAFEKSSLKKQLLETVFSAVVLQAVLGRNLTSFGQSMICSTSNLTSESYDPAVLLPEESIFEKIKVMEENQKKQDTKKQELSQEMRKLINQVQGRRHDYEDLDGYGIEALGETLYSVMYSDHNIDLETADIGSDVAEEGALKLLNLSSASIFPIGDKLDEVVAGLIGALDKTLARTTPDFHHTYLHVEICTEGLNAEEKLYFQKRIMDERMALNKQRTQAAQTTVPKVEDIITYLWKVMLSSEVMGQHMKKAFKKDLALATAKISARAVKGLHFAGRDCSIIFKAEFNQSENDNRNLNVKMSEVRKNPYTYAEDDSAHDISPPVVSWQLEDEEGHLHSAGKELSFNCTRPISNGSIGVFSVNKTRQGEEGLCHHKFQLKKDSEVIFVFVDIGNETTNLTGYFRYDEAPTTYGSNVVKLASEPVVGDLSMNGSGKSFVNRFFVKPLTFKRGLIYVGLAIPEGVDEYKFLVYTDSCRVWNRNQSVWTNESCKVSPLSSLGNTVCDCFDAPDYTFGSSFYIPPNLIDFDLVFKKFDAENASVYGTLISLFIVFVFLAVWARRKVKEDIDRWQVGYLSDNLAMDNYYYLLTVHTGLSRGSGTSSRVSFVLTGVNGDTGVRLLTDGKRHLSTGSVVTYVMATPYDLGELSYLRIWHDNSGEGQNQSWYLNKIYVEDLQTRTRSVFFGNQWLAMDQDDGRLDRIIPVSCKNDLMTFSRLFSEHSRVNLTDSHTWLSVILCPEKSMFTRVQRLATCLMTLHLAMIANALFYKPEDGEGVSSNSPGPEIQIGQLRFSLTTLYTSVVSGLITVPPVLLVVWLFKQRRPWRSSEADRSRRLSSHHGGSTVPLEGNLSDSKASLNIPDSCEANLVSRFDKNPLPPWCLYVAWTIMTITSLSCCFFLLLYSMQWGKTVSEEWLASFFLSFLESVFVLDPVKVILLTCFLAFFLRNPHEDYDSRVSLETVCLEAPGRGCQDRGSIPVPPAPVPDREVVKMRNQKLQEQVAVGVLVELVLHIIFMFCLFSFSYSNRDERSFQFQDHVLENLFRIPKRRVNSRASDYLLPWSKVLTHQDVFTWLNTTMTTRMFPASFLSGKELSQEERQFTADMANYRVGPVRVRQVRTRQMMMSDIHVDKMTSHPEYLVGEKQFYWPYDITSEETGSYCMGWQHKPCSLDKEYIESATLNSWVHRSTLDENSIPIMGKLHLYSGGGYITDLGGYHDIIPDVFISELYENRWLDLQTRAVFIEFSLYNVDANLLATVRLVVEFPVYGSGFPWVDVRTLRIYPHVGPLGSYILMCSIILVISLIVFSFKVMKQLFREGRLFLKSFWGTMDLMIVLCCIAAIVFYILKTKLSSDVMGRFKEKPKLFVNFYALAIYDDIFGWTLAFIVFLSTVRIMRILGYNQRVTMIATVLQRAGKDLFSFSFLYLLMIGVFVMFGYMLFHSTEDDFMSPWNTFVTIVYLLLGKNVIKNLEQAPPVLVRIYFALLSFTLVFVLMTMFQAILNASATQVRTDAQNAPEPYGIINVLQKMYNSLVVNNRLLAFLRCPIGKRQNQRVSPEKNHWMFGEPETSDALVVFTMMREYVHRLNGDTETTMEGLKKEPAMAMGLTRRTAIEVSEP